MALGLSITAPIAPEGFLVKHTPTHPELLGRLLAAIPAMVPEALRPFLWMESAEESLLVGFHPAEEPARFFFPTAAVLGCEARTSGAGPGYHAFLVELLQKVGSKCRLRWQWDGETTGDDTGFQQHKDFARLRMDMLKWLKGTCGAVLEQATAGATNIKVSLPLDYPSIASDAPFVLTPLGPRTREWVEKMSKADGVALQTAGAEFFPWWGRKPDAIFWRNTGLALAWVELPWHPATNEQEQELYGLAQYCFQMVQQGKTTVELPRGLVESIEVMRAGDDTTCPPPDPADVGYRRRVMEYALPGRWSIPLPGYYYVRVEANGDRQVFSYGARVVSVTTLSVASRSENASFEEHLLQKLKALHYDAELLKFQRGALLGRAAVSRGADDAAWTLTGYVAASNNLALVTVTFPGAADEEWATGVWQSLKHPEG